MLAHGPREMPIWGRGYYFDLAEPTLDPFTGEMGWSVRVRILALIDYINRMQAK